MRTVAYSPVILIALASFTATPASAADDRSTDSLDTIVVTATRTDQPRALTGESVSVITATDLAAEQTLVVSDALQETPGLTVVRNGGVGQTTSIGLRGAEAGQTLVLIDGVHINDPSAPDGAAILSDLLVNDVERIEVLRGPQSTLYGSDAMAGVVNILSKRGGTTPLGFSGSTEGGSLGTYRENIAANGMDGPLDYGAAVNYYHTAGISAADARLGNTEADGYHNFGATGNVRWHVADTLSIDVRAYYTDTRTEFDGYPPPNYTFQDTPEYGTDTLLALYTGVNADSFDGHFHNRLAYTGSWSDRKDFDPTLAVTEDFYARGDSSRFEYQGIVDATKTDQVTFGAETQRTSLRTGAPSAFDPNPTPTSGDTRINGYYAQYQTTLLHQLTLTGGVRRDTDAEFGGHTSLKVSGAWKLFDGVTVLRANYGDGFKAPSLYELFSPYSNPVKNLAPESAHGWEVGVDQRFLDGRARASVTYFERRTSDQIDFFSCFGVVSPACTVRPFGYYDNIDRSKAHGIELEVMVQLSNKLSLTANYTHLEAIDLVTRNDLARRPRALANLRVQWMPASTWSLGVGASYTGSRFDDQFESFPLPGNTVVSLYASGAINQSLRVYARVENLLNRYYEPVAGYGALLRTVAVGMRVSL